MPIDIDRAIDVRTPEEFERWLVGGGQHASEVVVAIFKKSSGRQTVDLTALQEVALCHGWVDTQTKRIDDERYAIRFVPRRQGSNWSATNREMAHRMIAAGRVAEAGRAVLPEDL